MSKPKSDLLLALSLALLGGCDALRTPVPVDPESPLRASLTGFLVEGTSPTIYFARPIDGPAEVELLLPWIDLGASRLFAEQVVSSGFIDSSRAGISHMQGLRGAAVLWDLRPSMRVDRIRGSLRWNASAPYRMSDDEMVTDPVDLRPQAGARVRFLHDGVRGDLCLRWPKLAMARYDSLRIWSRASDSVVAFRNDWMALSLGRGDPAARILLLDTASRPGVYRYFDPDTSVMRRVMAGESGQKAFLAGDSIWLPNDRWATVLVGSNVDGIHRVFVNQSISVTSNTSAFSIPSALNGTTLELARPDAPMEFGFRDLYGGSRSSRPVRVMIQIAGTCPAFEDWRRYGSTDRWHRPTGNVAPFDGYLCEIFPDTISFPRGDIILIPPDTSTQPKVEVKVDSLKFLPVIKSP